MPDLAPVRLNILSDLHLSRGSMPLPAAHADVVILAGDIARPERAIEWALQLTTPVVYVPGNHEFYGSSISATIDELKRRCAGTHIHVLDKEEITLHGVRFLGATLWTDFMLFGPGEQRTKSIAAGLEFIRDFSRIQSDHNPREPFTPLESEGLFHAHRAWLEQKLDEPVQQPTVVITHHAPSPRSIHPRFEGSLINTCFVSDIEYLMSAKRARLWIHGHVHDSFDYVVNGTRVVSNPRGYVKDGINENASFNPDLIVTVER